MPFSILELPVQITAMVLHVGLICSRPQDALYSMAHPHLANTMGGSLSVVCPRLVPASAIGRLFTCHMFMSSN